IDQVNRIAQVPDDRHETPSEDYREPCGEDYGAGVAERDGVGRPPRAAQPGQPVDPIGPATARPHRVAPVATRAREPEPRRLEGVPPRDAAADRIDPHETVLAGPVVGDEERAVRERYEVSGSVPTATWRPAGRIRHPEGSTVVPSGCGP